MNISRFALPVLLGALAGCSKHSAETETAVKTTAVEVAPVIYSDEAVPVSATGLLARRTEVDLSFKVPGVIESISVRAGDTVTAGQVLAQVRPDEIEAQVATARSLVEKAQRDLGRVEKLQAGKVATLENLQDARTAVDVANAQLKAAEFNRRYAQIIAPAAGRILRRTAEPNALIGAGYPVLSFASDDDGWIVRAGLAESDISRVHAGDRAEVSLSRDSKPLAGKVVHLSEAADPGTRTTQVEVALDAAPAGARSGFVASVTITPQTVTARPVVPAAALIEGSEHRANVFVVEEGNKAKRLPVDVEALRGAKAYLRSELPRTARVVVRGGEYLRDGTTVEIAKGQP